MAVSSIIMLALLLVRLAVFFLPLYVLVLAARALRKYLSEPSKEDSRDGMASEGVAGEGDKKQFWPRSPVAFAVLAVAAIIFIREMLGWRGGARAVSVIGGVDGPTSIFVAGKLGGMHRMHGIPGIMTVAHLGLLAAAAYLIYLIIRALRKYLGQ